MYKSMLKQQAQKQLRAIWRRNILKKILNIARTCKVFRDKYASTVQKYLKGTLARNRVKKMQK